MGIWICAIATSLTKTKPICLMEGEHAGIPLYFRVVRSYALPRLFIWGLFMRFTGFVVAVAGLAVVQAASAADMPTKMPIKAGPWWRPRLGQASTSMAVLAMGCGRRTRPILFRLRGLRAFCETQVQGGKGWLATIGAGYDYQFAPKIVAGIFGEASISSLKGTIQDRAIPGQGEIKQTSSWAAGGRVGWLVTRNSELHECWLHGCALL